jgi:hypothetical protein
VPPAGTRVADDHDVQFGVQQIVESSPFDVVIVEQEDPEPWGDVSLHRSVLRPLWGLDQ